MTPKSHDIACVRGHFFLANKEADWLQQKLLLSWELEWVYPAKFCLGFGITPFIELRLPWKAVEVVFVGLMRTDVGKVS